MKDQTVNTHPPIPDLPPLHGDGIHDDTAAIQARLDSGAACVYLPPPHKNYLIRQTLRIHSGQTLRLDSTTVIRLADGSDCLMITNRDVENGNRHISLVGGIWDMNNPGQGDGHKTGLSMPQFGILMRFDNVEHLTISGITLRDPHAFGMLIARLKYFTIEDVTLDYQHLCSNNDGIHIEGGCRYGTIRNVKGITTDDIIAINGDDFNEYVGLPIEDLTVDGVYSDCATNGIRVMSCGANIRNITIENIHGNYMWYAVAFSKFHMRRPRRGRFDNIVLRNFFCRKGAMPENVRGFGMHAGMKGKFDSAQIILEEGVDVGTLVVDGFQRTERLNPTPVLSVSRGATIRSLNIRNVSVENLTGQPHTFAATRGRIRNLALENVCIRSEAGGVFFDNNGTIRNVRMENIDFGELNPGGVAALPERFAGFDNARILDFVPGNPAFATGDCKLLREADRPAYLLPGESRGLVCEVRSDLGEHRDKTDRGVVDIDATYQWHKLGQYDLFQKIGSVHAEDGSRMNAGPTILRIDSAGGAGLELRVAARSTPDPIYTCISDDIPLCGCYDVWALARRDEHGISLARIVLVDELPWRNLTSRLDLAQGWRFKTDPDNRGLDEDWQTVQLDESWRPIGILDGLADSAAWRKEPTGWKSLVDYNGTAWYACEFECPKMASGDQAWLVFHGVDGEVTAWLDGECVGSRYNLDITWHHTWAPTISGMLKPGKTIRLALRVSKDLYDAGIWQPVEIRYGRNSSADK